MSIIFRELQLHIKDKIFVLKLPSLVRGRINIFQTNMHLKSHDKHRTSKLVDSIILRTFGLWKLLSADAFTCPPRFFKFHEISLHFFYHLGFTVPDVQYYVKELHFVDLVTIHFLYFNRFRLNLYFRRRILLLLDRLLLFLILATISKKVCQ